jgi:hypothetical protein
VALEGVLHSSKQENWALSYLAAQALLNSGSILIESFAEYAREEPT